MIKVIDIVAYLLVPLFIFMGGCESQSGNRLVGNWVFDADLQIKKQLPLLQEKGRIDTEEKKQKYITEVRQVALFRPAKLTITKDHLIMQAPDKKEVKMQYRVTEHKNKETMAWVEESTDPPKYETYKFEFYGDKMCMTRWRKGDYHEPACFRRMK